MKSLVFIASLLLCLVSTAQSVNLTAEHIQIFKWNEQTKKYDKFREASSLVRIQQSNRGVTFSCSTCPTKNLEIDFTSAPEQRQIDENLEGFVYEGRESASHGKVTVTFTFNGSTPKTVSVLADELLLVYSRVKFD